MRISTLSWPQAAVLAAHTTLATAALALAAPAQTRACSCAEQSVAQALEAADAIFEGRVVDLGPAGGKPPSGIAPATRVVRMQVVRVWKGSDEREQVEVRTASSEAACGYPFRSGESYLVYARAVEDKLRASLCSRTSPIEQATEDLDALGAGVVPVDPHEIEPERPEGTGNDTASATPSPTQGGCASCTVGGLGLEGWLPPVLALVALTARRRPRSAR